VTLWAGRERGETVPLGEQQEGKIKEPKKTKLERVLQCVPFREIVKLKSEGGSGEES